MRVCLQTELLRRNHAQKGGTRRLGPPFVPVPAFVPTVLSAGSVIYFLQFCKHLISYNIIVNMARNLPRSNRLDLRRPTYL